MITAILLSNIYHEKFQLSEPDGTAQEMEERPKSIKYEARGRHVIRMYNLHPLSVLLILGTFSKCIKQLPKNLHRNNIRLCLQHSLVTLNFL